MGRRGNARLACLWNRIFDDRNKDRTYESKDDDAVKPNEPIAHLPYIGAEIGIHLVKASVHVLEALLYTLSWLRVLPISLTAYKI